MLLERTRKIFAEHIENMFTYYIANINHSSKVMLKRRAIEHSVAVVKRYVSREKYVPGYTGSKTTWAFGDLPRR